MNIPETIQQAVARQKVGDMGEAEKLLLRVLEEEPDNPDALHLYGLIEQHRGNHERAAHIIELAIARNGTAPVFHSNLGTVYRALERPDDAERAFRTALAMRPAYADAHNNLATLLVDTEREDEAICHYRIAIALRPEYAAAHNNLGGALARTGDHGGAVREFRKALEIDPEYAEAWYNLGNTWVDLRDIAAGIDGYERAIAVRADYVDAHANLSLALLLNGDLRRGFAEYEWRWRSKQTSTRNYPQARWKGETFSGQRLFIHAEQGMGDAIQFVRYIPMIARRGGEIIVECDRALLGLFSRVAGIKALVPRFSTPPPFELHIPIMDLPRVLGTTLDTIPAEVPYLSAPPDPDPILQLPDDGYFKVGFVWAGNRDFPMDHNRSIPMSAFLELIEIPQVRLYSLQKGKDAQQMSRLAAAARVRDVSGRLRDFSDTAAVIQQLDLTISVDTAVAHLCGALGRPVWTLLPFVPDWRWQLERKDTPWYPSMRLFRQASPGDWRPVFQQVFEALDELVAQAP